MQVQQKKTRISRIKLRNIANPNHYKPVTQRNNVFLKVKRNSAVLSQTQNVQEKFYQIIEAKEISSHQSMIELLNKKHSVREVRQSRQSRRYSSANHSIGSSSSLNKRLPNLMVRQIRQSKQLSLSSSKSNKAFDDSQNSSRNQIQGTPIGVLSTKQILKKYEIKKLTQQMNKKKFLDDYIQNLKQGGFEIDEDADDPNGQHLAETKPYITQNLSTNLTRPQSTKDKNLINSQEKLVHLLQNRVTDRDFIDFNVKLFEKRDINKKKFFQRYHNILKQQRKQIIQK